MTEHPPVTSTKGPNPNPPLRLAAKLAKAMGEIGRVPKRGHNQAQNYHYARADDVAEHTREILSSLGVAVFASVENKGIREIETKNGKARISMVVVTWTFVDGETGEERSVSVPGEGADFGDKGLYKAMTGSLKYALMLNFLIPTGEGDPEKDEEEKPKPRPNAAAQVAAARAKVRDPVARTEAVKASAMRTFGTHVAAKAQIEKVIGRSFGDKPIAGLTDKELELLEQWTTLAKATENAEAKQ